jgi:hypothetical protein
MLPLPAPPPLIRGGEQGAVDSRWMLPLPAPPPLIRGGGQGAVALRERSRSTGEHFVECPARSRRDVPSMGFHHGHFMSPRQWAPKQ